MDLELREKVAIVTGSSRGLGLGSAAALVQEGCRVTICARGQTRLQEAAAELLKTLTVTGKAVLIDVALDENMSRSVRNIAGVTFVSSQRVTARDIIDARRVVVTKSALEKLQEALA